MAAAIVGGGERISSYVIRDRRCRWRTRAAGRRSLAVACADHTSLEDYRDRKESAWARRVDMMEGNLDVGQ